MPAALAARLRALYDSAEAENHRAILALMPPAPGATLVDLGCGDGAFTVRAARHVGAERVLGVETAGALAAAARDRGVEIAERDLGDALPYADGSIGVVLSNQVIEHLSDTDRFLREIRRVLAPAGYAVISTNNLASWHNVASLVAGWQPMPAHVSDEVLAGNPLSFADGPTGGHYPMHRRLFTPRGLAGAASHHGLALDADVTAGFYPLPPRAARLAARLDRRHGAFLVQRYRARS